MEPFPLTPALKTLADATVAFDNESGVLLLLLTDAVLLLLLSVCIPRPAATKSPTPFVAPELDEDGICELPCCSVLVALMSAVHNT